MPQVYEGDDFEIELLQFLCKLSDVPFGTLKVIQLLCIIALIAYQQSYLSSG
jgi:hypothetical protein